MEVACSLLPLGIMGEVGLAPPHCLTPRLGLFCTKKSESSGFLAQREALHPARLGASPALPVPFMKPIVRALACANEVPGSTPSVFYTPLCVFLPIS